MGTKGCPRPGQMLTMCRRGRQQERSPGEFKRKPTTGKESRLCELAQANREGKKEGMGVGPKSRSAEEARR